MIDDVITRHTYRFWSHDCDLHKIVRFHGNVNRKDVENLNTTIKDILQATQNIARTQHCIGAISTSYRKEI